MTTTRMITNTLTNAGGQNMIPTDIPKGPAMIPMWTGVVHLPRWIRDMIDTNGTTAGVGSLETAAAAGVEETAEGMCVTDHEWVEEARPLFLQGLPRTPDT